MKNKLLSISILAALAATSFSQNRAGLIDWYERLTTYSEIPNNSLTIALLGDSHMEGVINKLASDPLTDNYGWKFANLLRRDIRGGIHPNLGGIGFVPMVDSAASPILGPGGYTGGEKVGIWTDHRLNTDPGIKGVCLKYTQTNQAGAYKRWSATSGSFSNASKNFGGTVNAYQFVYQTFPGAGTLEVSLTSWGGGIVYDRVTVNCDGPESYGNLTPVIRNPGGAFWVVVKNLSPFPIRVEGAYLYAAEPDIRMANYACGGSIAENYNNDEAVDAMLKSNPDLIGLWWGHNEILGFKSTFAEWKASLRGVIQKIQSKSRANIFLIHGFYFQPNQLAVWDQMQAELEQIAKDCRVALVSLHEASERQGAPWLHARGYLRPGAAHLSREGQVWAAGLLKAVLDKRVTVG